jgi:hypothetical protein
VLGWPQCACSSVGAMSAASCITDWTQLTSAHTGAAVPAQKAQPHCACVCATSDSFRIVKSEVAHRGDVGKESHFLVGLAALQTVCSYRNKQH